MNFYLGNSYSHLLACTGGGVSLRCPEKLFLDITEDCSLRCPMCRDAVRMEGRTMPMELFRRAVEETAPFVKSYSLFLWGEPIVLRDFRERVRYVRERMRPDCVIEISTNGTLLTSEMIGFLRENEVSVIVSLDSADEATFEKIRRGARFGQVCQNARNLAEAYADAPLELAPCSYTTVQRDNQEGLKEISILAAELGLRRIGFGLLTGPARFAPALGEALCRALEAAYDAAAQNGLLLELYPTRVGNWLCWGGRYVPKEGFWVDGHCPAPFQNAVVRYDGAVCLCCKYGAAVDNMNERSFSEIWDSAEYDALREAVNTPGKMPPACINCPWVNR